jgi:homoserine O-acetyltransferase
MTDVPDYEIFELDLALENGTTLPGAKLAYKTWGTLNAEKSNAIVLPTAYGGTHADNAWLTEPGKACDAATWFVISPNMFGAGLSSSPSNTPAPHGRGAFPHVTIYDNVAAQHALVTQKFGITKLALVAGFSMGAIQTYHWAAAYPEMVKRIAPYCGSARCANHNFVFLEGVRAALTADPAFKDGWYDDQPIVGKRAVGRVWAGWGLSQTWYREERWTEMELGSREAVLDYYADSFAESDANDLLAMLWTWQNADISKHPRYQGDFKKALASITATAVVMPGQTDLYFPPEDSEIEVESLPDGELAVIPSVWGHAAGGPVVKADADFIDGRIARLLAR